MKKPKVNRPALESRMAEHLDNWQAQRKPKTPSKGVKYDWAAKRVVREEMAGHRKSWGICGDAARENYERIFSRNAK